ncbi:MAG: gliding motility-associated C-terminal domain-containing protein, partial [Bacteroidetes bacterium]|nr:gliding motility-associated C-terminal domain-containing protein [Bacteroidota bacterium]
GLQSCTITGTPGTWTFVVNDPSNSCQTALSFQVLQNTVTPHVAVDFIAPTQTLTCKNPTIFATGTSTTANTFVTWQQPNVPGTVASNTIILGPGSGPATSTTTIGLYANYTVVATNTINACRTLSTVVINQNFKAPNAQILTLTTPSVINCNGVPVTLSSNTSVNSNTVNGGIAQITQWAGPSPQGTLVTGAAQYSANVYGDYTLTVKDSYNGCITTATINIKDATTPPIIATPNATVPSGCGDNALLQVNLSLSLANWSLFFKTYPAGAQFNPASAIQPIGSPTFAGSTGTVQVNLPGSYEYIVTNMNTGCRAIGTFSVGQGGLNADFGSDVITGYAPLTVNFNNLSSTSIGATSSITSVWNFGNGTSSLTTNPNVNTSYIAPGSYTVMMISTRGGCSDTAYRMIKVEIPSKMEVPNVFTPNGDGSNDVFFLKTANLTEITALIYDRWGNKVYEVTSTTGNIAWDGNNSDGKTCAAGTYFYIIKATGKDSKGYEQKGTVSLLR